MNQRSAWRRRGSPCSVCVAARRAIPPPPPQRRAAQPRLRADPERPTGDRQVSARPEFTAPGLANGRMRLRRFQPPRGKRKSFVIVIRTEQQLPSVLLSWPRPLPDFKDPHPWGRRDKSSEQLDSGLVNVSLPANPTTLFFLVMRESHMTLGEVGPRDADKM